jgi:hypothetical protein
MGGSSSSTPADTSKTIHFAAYVEEKHSNLLNTVATLRASLISDSPYGTYTAQAVDDAVFGIGFAVANFASLYDMYGKFMSGYDLEALWSVTMSDQANLTEVNLSIQADAVLIDENLIINSTPAFKIAMRDRNAVSSSSFVIGKASIECQRTKDLANLSADSKFKLLPDLNTKYNAVLNWQKGVTDSYSELMKLYYMTAVQGAEADTTFGARETLWPFDVLDFERAVLGTMRQNAGYQKGGLQRKRSTLSKVLLVASWTANGAYIGAQIGGAYGAVIGAVIGFCIGVANILFE